ncbi:MAG: class I SAM-dependent methyltransferase [Epsilonproteobacteria bacterium]|nr:class I SAM-dependent methyltransferase [Campylobacterota bacterium]OIO14207.1 MAG: hypothetical protein AUJ81_09830 [Helicobacteraceae bacterium CG1_02_36_14]PIP09929.1 MAG: hypothetical protein COX50_08335 [Sulfurimonas sp. CG23_combo_of_CG06-09_8_20_14_all_36_33]PIS26882.1 MAG: class I SAM-dependent methyltransferase [Sulfurimonas sp. CG08_land_8_20_14_0_20_36_33]PIU34697.1 MAG: class I SAM-dependent methyltransferase [Sulfurimonas sp. CG07_land_8_20_14_0_80_36_56]PIV03591.1 MAG: class I
MPRIDSEKFYTSAIGKYGITPQGLNWNSKLFQDIRFSVLLEMLPRDLSEITIADAGCGFGDLYHYMQEKPKEYIGIDSLQIMCEIASEKTSCKIIRADVCKDELPHADYYLCSGAMNVLKSFESYQFIRNCFLACGNGFIFNALHGEKESKTYNYLSTCQIETIAKELKVGHVEIRTDYLESDITVGFFK